MARRLIGLDIGTNAVRVAELELSDPPRLTSFGQVALPPGRHARRRGRRPRRGHRRDPAPVEGAEPQEGAGAHRRGQPARARAHRRPADDVGRRARRRPAIPGPGPDPDPARGRRPRLPGARVAADARGRGRRPAAPADVAGAARGGAQGPHPQPHRRRPGRRAVGRRRRPRPAGAGALGRPPGLGQRQRGRGHREHRRRRDRRRRPRARHPALRPHPRIGRPLGHRRGGPRPRAHAPTRPRRSSARWTPRRPTSPSARTRAMARPISDLVEQIRGSLDYYRTQPDSIRLLKVTLTGGGALTPGLVDQLVDTVGVPVDLARPREHIAVGDIGFPDDQLPLLDPFLPVPVGLALGGLLTGKRIDLLGTRVKEPIDRAQLIRIGAIAAAVLLVVLGGLYFLKKSQVDDERDKLARGRGRRTARCRARSARSPTSRSARRRSRRSRSRPRPCSPPTSRGRRCSRGSRARSRRTSGSRRSRAPWPGAAPRGRRRRRRRPHRRTGHRQHDRHHELRRRRHQLRRRGRVDPPHRLRRPVLLRTSGCRARRRAARPTSTTTSTERERHVLLDRQPDRQGQEQPGRPVQGDAVKRNQLLIGGAALLAIVLLWYFVLYAPLGDDLSSAQAQTAAEQKKTDGLQADLARLQAQAKNAHAAAGAAAQARRGRARAARPRGVHHPGERHRRPVGHLVPLDRTEPAGRGRAAGASVINLTISIEGSFFQLAGLPPAAREARAARDRRRHHDLGEHRHRQHRHDGRAPDDVDLVERRRHDARRDADRPHVHPGRTDGRPPPARHDDAGRDHHHDDTRARPPPRRPRPPARRRPEVPEMADSRRDRRTEQAAARAAASSSGSRAR